MIKRIDQALEKINRYRKKKADNIFDDFYHADLDIMKKALSFYRSAIIKKSVKGKDASKPECYRPNNDPYPLCCGASHPQEFAENDCIHCCWYENTRELW